MKRFISATAIAVLLTTGAFAQSNATDARQRMMPLFGDDAAIVDMFMDETGKDRDDADFETRMKAMTPEQVEIAKGACTKTEDTTLGFSDMVVSRCKAITTPKT